MDAGKDAAELTRLTEAAESVCDKSGNKPEPVVLRRLSSSRASRKTHAGKF